MCALTLTACASSIKLPPSPAAKIPAAYLQQPGPVPKPRRNADGTQDGAAAHGTQLDLYDYIGGLLGQLTRLQCAVMASQGDKLPAWCPATKDR